ncbi:MAG TPA: NAD(P)-dependent oxidoreductase [Novosphingobium sp.]|nr:NAD(P)-dependent oxidoreductase [Novosphingobium sp.]
MLQTLPLFHRIAGRPVVVLGTGEAAGAKRRLVERAGGVVVGDLDQGIATGARLAFIAHDDEGAAEADAARARSAGLLVNATDRPDLCDFTVPSILDRSPVLVAIGTGGASAGLAKQLRLRLETLLPQSLGALAKALEAARAGLRARFPDAGERRRALDGALRAGGALDPLCEGSAARVEEWLAGAECGPARMVEIALRSGDPEDLTLREARLLGSADLVAFEKGVPTPVLDRARADAVRVLIGRGEIPSGQDGIVVLLRRPANG